MATARLEFGNEVFATIISNEEGAFEISAPTKRIKRWAIKTLKKEAASLGITLEKKNGAWYADPQKLAEVEWRLFTVLNSIWRP